VERLRGHPVAVTLAAFGLAAAAVVAIAAAFGFGAFADAWSHLRPGWLAFGLGAELLAFAAYGFAYRAAARVHSGPDLPSALVARVVMAGFGPFSVSGGFAIDKRALAAVDGDERRATVRVLGLGALEWALLAPAAWLCAVVLLASGGSGVMPSLLWPWAIAVPVGFAIALWLAEPNRRERIAAGGPVRRALGVGLQGVGILRSLAANVSTSWSAWLGTAAYWALDIAAFYGAIRFVGLQPDLGETVLAYATGYALTRRSTPLGGAGTTETLMTFALHWVGEPVPVALAAVLVYRVWNFVVPTVPALLARPRIEALCDASDAGRPAPRRVQQRAAAPLGQQ
jgi:uncharacterized membrane protein YbhN (UPF0104 family)